MKNHITRQDFFPNYMSWELKQPSNDTFVTDKIFTPIPRNQQIKGNKAIVMELLFLDVDYHNLKLDAGDEEVFYALSLGAPPITLSAAYLSRGNTICAGAIECIEKSAGASGIGMTHVIKPVRYNFQTTDGYGFLLATDAFNAVVDSSNTGIQNTVFFRLYYRFVQIPVTEFIGLVQSQQGS